MKQKYGKLLKKSGIRLDVGCGENKQHGFVGMDMRKVKGVDIVHNIEEIPYPLPDESCCQILISNVIEHICPRKILGLMNELWRIMKPDGQLLIQVPFAGSLGFWQDPTHCHTWNEATAYYFDPHPKLQNTLQKFNMLYNLYKPLPWMIVQNEYTPEGNINITMYKQPKSAADSYFPKGDKNV